MKTTFLRVNDYAYAVSVETQDDVHGDVTVQISTEWAPDRESTHSRAVLNLTLTQLELQALINGLAFGLQERKAA